jgi:hypothetical protein
MIGWRICPQFLLIRVAIDAYEIIGTDVSCLAGEYFLDYTSIDIGHLSIGEGSLVLVYIGTESDKLILDTIDARGIILCAGLSLEREEDMGATRESDMDLVLSSEVSNLGDGEFLPLCLKEGYNLVHEDHMFVGDDLLVVKKYLSLQ